MRLAPPESCAKASLSSHELAKWSQVPGGPSPYVKPRTRWTEVPTTVAVPKPPGLKSSTSAHLLTSMSPLMSPRKAGLYDPNSLDFLSFHIQTRPLLTGLLILEKKQPRLSQNNHGFCWPLFHLLIRPLPPLTPSPCGWSQSPSPAGTVPTSQDPARIQRGDMCKAPNSARRERSTSVSWVNGGPPQLWSPPPSPEPAEGSSLPEGRP